MLEEERARRQQLERELSAKTAEGLYRDRETTERYSPLNVSTDYNSSKLLTDELATAQQLNMQVGFLTL